MPTVGLLAGTAEPGLIENMGKAPSFTSVRLSRDDTDSTICSICSEAVPLLEQEYTVHHLTGAKQQQAKQKI